MRRLLRRSLRLGFPAMLHYLVNHYAPSSSLISIRPRAALHPLKLRAFDSDLDVLSQIFIEQHYADVRLARPDGLVIDCGANVGLSSAYFLSRFPAATVIAIEPDPGNFELLQTNLAPYGTRARPVKGAIWSHDCHLQITTRAYDDGRSWARQVEPSPSEDTGTVRGIGIGSLLDGSGFDRISLLKMDIEGAEAIVFGDGHEKWLPRTDCLAVELHDDTHFGNATAAFDEMVRPLNPALSRSGEIVVASFRCDEEIRC